MKKRSWILLTLCLLLFISFRLLPSLFQIPSVSKVAKPTLPEPVDIAEKLSLHPWVERQGHAFRSNLEAQRDMAALEELCEAIERQKPALTKQQVESALTETLLSLQEEIPFSFPEDLYSVLCITETPLEWIDPPTLFHVYKRLYLGEMRSGLPFYLDVRVFELNEVSPEEVITWHLTTLNGEPERHFNSGERVVYTVKGKRVRNLAHGFAEGERGLFMDAWRQGEKLYVLYAEAPIPDFLEKEKYLTQFIKRTNDE